MLTIVDSEVKTVSPDTAQSLLGQNKYHYQRPINHKTVALYQAQMELGEWVAGSEMLVLGKVRNDDDWSVLNGQHRLAAQVAAGATIVYTVQRVLADTTDELAGLYGVIDSGKSRPPAELLWALQLPQEFGLGRFQVNAVSAAMHVINADFNTHLITQARHLTRAALAVQVREYGDIAGQFFECIAGASRHAYNGLTRAANLALGLVTLRYSASVYGVDRVEAFWAGIAKDEQLSWSDPRKVANNHLITTSYSNIKGILGVDVVSPGYQVRYVAACFNFWTEGKEFKTAHRRSTPRPEPLAPIRINGTPWKG